MKRLKGYVSLSFPTRRLNRIQNRMLITLTILSLILVSTSLPLSGQATNSGTVVGQVTDPSGAVVVGATVALIDLSTNTPLTTVTNESGHFAFINTPPGNYDVMVTKQGFDRARVQKQHVNVGMTLTENVRLKIGGTTQEIQVEATGTDLQTLNATVGNTVNSVAIDNLPSLGRDVSTFVSLQPGISPDGSVAGTVVDQSTFMLDGGNNTNDMDGSMSVYTTSFAGDPTGGVANQSYGVAAGPTGVMPTPADSVEEFKVNTTNQTADFNSSSGAQVQVVTKRGTNNWHGSAYEYYLDNNLNANTWVNNFTGTPNASYHYSRFGASFGGPLTRKSLLGGQTFFFANYQGFRWPNATTVERAVPSASMRLGLLYFNNQYYNLNPGAVTFNGVTYPGSGTTLDPRGLGVNPLVQQIWNKYMPLPNESGCGLSRCDVKNGVGNVGGFLANVAIPQTDNFGVFRVDHDFGSKWHFTSSYRYYKLQKATTSQVDIGGFFPGDTLGVPAAVSNRPQQPWYLVAGLTTNISNTVTNDFHFSYLRNYWSWGTKADPPQLAGLAGALEPFGETATQALIPYNVNTQQTRTRFWDGHDWMFRDDVSMLHGKHLFAFGGTYQRNWDYHQRTDNGGGINYQTVYQLGTTAGAGIDMTGFVPTGASSKNWGRDYAATLGIVSISQIAYTRTGANLNLNPPNTPASDKSTIPYYNVYFSDTWKIKPTFTLTYGLGWTLEMPPTEEEGKQIELVDSSNQPISTEAYLNSRERAALNGDVFNPTVGFALVGNTAQGLKYPYNPYYGSFSPRVAAAWSPQFDSNSWLAKIFGHNDSVIRGGYSRIFGRLNGVDLVLVPLLGTGLIQPVQCKGALTSGGCSSSANPSTAFRIGADGMAAPLPAASPTLPQPLYPGINGVAAGAGEALDPNFRPNVVDSVTFTIQRQLNRRMVMEMGYIGRWINHEYTPVNINAVPYMMTKGGQRFDKAYAAVVMQYCGGFSGLAGGNCAGNAAAVTPQPFFEAALAGTGYCNGFANCTAAVVANEGNNGTGNLSGQNVWSLWSDLDNGGFNFPRSMMNTPLAGPLGSQGQLTSGVGVNASIGYGNYNAGFVSFKMNDWHGLTTQSNFTWAKALGTGAEVQATSEDTLPDPYNLDNGYGLQAFDRKFVYNFFAVYELPFYKSQQGVLGHVLGGWSLAPVFTAGTGLPITLGTINGGGQAYGEGDSVNFFGYGNSENAIPVGPLPATGIFKTNGANGVGTSGYGINLVQNPEAAFNAFRQPILGIDRNGGFGSNLRGLGYWNVDVSVKKQFKITERFNLQTQMVVTNLFNHVNFSDPSGDYLDTSSPDSWGVLPGAGTPRSMEFGIRLSF